MKKIDLKLIGWGVLAAISTYSAFFTGFFGMFVFSVLALLAVFVVCLAAVPPVRILTAVLVVAGGYLASGVYSIPFTLLLFLLPAAVMAFVIRRSKDFSITLCTGTGVFCLGIMAIDKFFIQPEMGGIRLVFSSVVDSVEANWHAVLGQISMQSGIDVTETAELLTGFFYGIKLMLPAIILIAALALMFFVLLFSRRLILNIPVPPFFMLHIPRSVAYVYFAGYIISGMTASSDTTGMILTNVTVVLSAVLMFGGLALVRFFTRKIPSRVLSVTVFIIAVPVSFYIPGFLITCGMIDAVINFRRMVK